MFIIKRIFNKIKSEFGGMFLAVMKSEQKKRFYELKPKFLAYVNKFNDFDLDKFLINEWRGNLDQLTKDFSKNITLGFLRHPVLTKTMFVGDKPWIRDELSYLSGQLPPQERKFLLREDYIGRPLINNLANLTSPNSIHHLYHLIKYLDVTKCDLEKINTVIEWGGGYGNFAKIFWRKKKSATTYVIIDLPIFSCLQWLYLSLTLGVEAIKMIERPGQEIASGKINILPLSFLEDYKLNCELFISTWALSESSAFSQDYALSQGWLNAPHLLIACQKSNDRFPVASRLKDMINNVVVDDISWLPGNCYILR